MPQEPMRMREKVILRVVSKALIPFILLFALYVQFHGDYGPGGGFQAGVIFAAGLILYGLIYGLDAMQRAVPRRFIHLGIALGVLLYAGVGFLCLVKGGNFLDYSSLAPRDPSKGQHLGVLLVELGVGITVTCTLTAIFFAFAARGRRGRGA